MARTYLPAVGLAGCLLLGAACTNGPDPSPGSALSFGSCADRIDLAHSGIATDRAERLEFSCAVLQVPLDHEHLGGERIGIQVVRVRARDQAGRIGSLVMNPGGPGQSGLAFAPYWAGWLADDVLTRFDLVSFDPRGTGGSRPITCAQIPEDDELSRFPELLTRAGFARATATNRREAAACTTSLGDSAPFFSTEATALDLDLLRQALGDERLSYVGFSYGAKLGAEYARRFPHAVRALVLDGPSDPRADWVTLVERQAAGFEESFGQYAAGCPARPSCEPIGDPRSYIMDLVREADAEPIPSRRPGDDLPATGVEVLSAAGALLYDDATWPVLDSALIEAGMVGDSGSLWEAIDHVHGRDSSSGRDDAVAGFVINCNDSAPGPSDGQIKAAAARIERRNPVFGRLVSGSLFGCRFWTAERHVLKLPAAPTAPALLVIGTRHDPATPYAGAVSLAATLGNATLLTWEGQGHTAFGQSGCIDEQVYDYLVSLAVPARGSSCPA